MYGSETDYQQRRYSIYIRGYNTKVLTCAVDHVETEQKGCRPRITALDRAIVIMRRVNCISTEYDGKSLNESISALSDLKITDERDTLDSISNMLPEV